MIEQSKIKFKVTMEEYTQRGQQGIGIWLGGRYDEKSEPTFFFTDWQFSEGKEVLQIIQNHRNDCLFLQQQGTEPLPTMKQWEDEQKKKETK